jgi:hypothetical protein
MRIFMQLPFALLDNLALRTSLQELAEHPRENV